MWFPMFSKGMSRHAAWSGICPIIGQVLSHLLLLKCPTRFNCFIWVTAQCVTLQITTHDRALFLFGTASFVVMLKANPTCKTQVWTSNIHLIKRIMGSPCNIGMRKYSLLPISYSNHQTRGATNGLGIYWRTLSHSISVLQICRVYFHCRVWTWSCMPLVMVECHPFPPY